MEARKSADQPVTARNIIDGQEMGAGSYANVLSPYDGALITEVELADPAIVDAAVRAANRGAEEMAGMPGYERARLLRAASELLLKKSEAVASMLALETGKSIRDSRTELARAADVLSFCANEAMSIDGRHIPLEGSAAGTGKLAVGVRVPIGIIAGIIPFNAPVNLSCHKIGPALAAGNAIVVKAPPQAPGTVSMLVQVFLEAGFPPSSVGLVHGGPDVGTALIRNPKVGFLSFTGSRHVGEMVKQEAGLRGCILELGGVGPTVVHHDGNLEKAAEMCSFAGFRLAGQSCASVQNLFVHCEVFEDFKPLLVNRVSNLKYGNPMDPENDLGPVIDDRAAERIEKAIEAAVAGGASVLCGGNRQGRLIEPTVITDTTPDMDVVKDEIFGPVVVLRPYSEFREVVDWINGTELGINCGVFTESHQTALMAFREIHCATIVVNGTCTFRPDQLPYGGTGNSGYGRESPRDSIKAMTHERVIVFS
jgi:acyl-CoA reductase-like NAD-dependent aldehyde dehydrogenase